MSVQKKVLLVTCSFPPEPIVAAKISEEIANRLSESFAVTVLCPPPTRPLGMEFPDNKPKVSENYEVEIIEGFSSPHPSIYGRLRESYLFGKKVAQYIRQHHKEIEGIYAYPWPTAGLYIILSSAEKYNIPVVTHIQDLYPESLLGKMGLAGKMVRPLLVAFDKLNMKLSTHIIAISPQMKATLVKTRSYPRENVIMVRNWQDYTLFKDVKSEFPERFTIMFVGSISPSANVPLLIRSFVRADIPGSRFIIAGSGSQKDECMALAASYPHAEIEFMEITSEKTPELQSKASVLVFGLKKNVALTATPSKLVAYMYSAKPVIGSADLGSDADMILQESDGGEVVDAEDEEGLAMLMRRFSRKSNDELREIGEHARKYAVHNFEKNANLELIYQTIHDMVTRKKS